MKTEFPRTHLAAASHFMADRDIRYYLVGVFVEVLSAETRLVATDGSIVGAVRHKVQNETPFDVIVPASVVKMAIMLKSHDFLTLERDDAGTWRLAGIPFVPVDGRFPDYRRVIPSGWSGAAAHLDPTLLGQFVKAGKALKRKDVPIVRQSGTAGALVHFYAFDDFVGVIMPMRMFTEKLPDLGAPTWGAERYA